FRGKAFGMRQEQFLKFLFDESLTSDEIVALRQRDILDTTDQSGLRLRVGGTERLMRGGAPLARAYLDRRRRVRLGGDPASTLFTDIEGAPIPADQLLEHMQRTRRQRISMTFNAVMCRGLLETRYGLSTGRIDEGCTAV